MTIIRTLKHVRFLNLPDKYDPWRRLLASVALRAVRDALNPNAKDQAEAIAFLADREIVNLLTDAGVEAPWQRIHDVVGKKAERSGTPDEPFHGLCSYTACGHKFNFLLDQRD